MKGTTIEVYNQHYLEALKFGPQIAYFRPKIGYLGAMTSVRVQFVLISTQPM